MLRTELTDRFSLEVPIIGAPMAGVAGGALAAAVSAGGGLGMIGVGNSTPADFIRKEAEVAHTAGRRFGIGLMAWALADRPDQFDVAVEARPSLVSVSFGDFGPWIERLGERGIPSATQVGDAREAEAAAKAGVDLIVARGSEAGGHGRDRVATLPLLQAVLDTVDVPVVAAGGIATGRGLAAVLAAGAAGAWVGTALLASPEGSNTAAARQKVLAASESDTVYTSIFDIGQRIPWPTEFGGRALVNKFSRRWTGREEELAANPDAKQELADARRRRDFDEAYIYAGQGVGRLKAEHPAAAVVADMAADAERHLAKWHK